jgi:predicted transcriptional regulator/nucleoside 2-deoxyribosyltransferase
MGTCFVMQPFDRGVYDKRYEDIFVPAIEAAGLEPYRIDRDPGVSIPIDEIQTGIKNSDVCLAEITTDNPNVWFELGYAIASLKEVVLVCSSERKTIFPFDVQHRNITRYETESSRDFEKLKEKITNRLTAILKKGETLSRIADMPSIADTEGLSQHELATLVTIAENIDSPSDKVGTYRIKEDMDRAGYTKIAVTLALTSLLRKGMIGEETEMDENGNDFFLYTVSSKGMEWLLQNQTKLVLKVQNSKAAQLLKKIDHDIPF